MKQMKRVKGEGRLVTMEGKGRQGWHDRGRVGRGSDDIGAASSRLVPGAGLVDVGRKHNLLCENLTAGH